MKLKYRFIYFFILLYIFLTFVGFTNLIKSNSTPASTVPGKWIDGDIIDNDFFWNTGFMTEAQIQDFLNTKGKKCKKNGSILCMKDYKENTRAVKNTGKDYDGYCLKDISAMKNASAAKIIKTVSNSCKISEQVILTTLEKEEGSITATKPNTYMYKTAMGFGCPDSGSCSSTYFGLFNQIYGASRAFNMYRVKGNYGKRPNTTVKIAYNPNISKCGTKSVKLQNWATAALYTYTPYVPNSASLKAGYGTGDSCSSYGNRNFFNLYTDWFGSTRGRALLGCANGLKGVRYKNKLYAALNINTSGVTKKYQWFLNGKKIKNATSHKYKPKYSQIGKKIKVKIYVSKLGYRAEVFGTKYVKIKKGIFNPQISLKSKYKIGKKIKAKIKNLPKGTTIVYKWYKKSGNKKYLIGYTNTLRAFKGAKTAYLKITLYKKGFKTKSFYSKKFNITK